MCHTKLHIVSRLGELEMAFTREMDGAGHWLHWRRFCTEEGSADKVSDGAQFSPASAPKSLGTFSAFKMALMRCRWFSSSFRMLGWAAFELHLKIVFTAVPLDLKRKRKIKRNFVILEIVSFYAPSIFRLKMHKMRVWYCTCTFWFKHTVFNEHTKCYTALNWRRYIHVL